MASLGLAPNVVAVPDSEVRVRRRRRHTREYKLSILKQAEKLKGKDGALGELLRREGLYTAALSTWRKQRDEGLLGQARGRKARSEETIQIERLEKENRKLKEKIGQYQLVIEAQKKNIGNPGDQAGERSADAGGRQRVRRLLDGLVGRVSMVFACSAMGIPRATAYRTIVPEPSMLQAVAKVSRLNPRAIPTDERKQVLDLLNGSRFVDKSPHEVYATLLDEGIYKCSVRSMYRILSENKEVLERRQIIQRPRYKRPELLATGPNQVWSWDIANLLTIEKWKYFFLYVLIDIFSRYVVGWLIAERESAELAKQLIVESCEKQGIKERQLTIHSDRGGPMKSLTLSQMYVVLGIERSLSRPSVSNDNPISESAFKTAKYHSLFPGRFGVIQDALEWGRAFFPWANDDHHHSGIGYFTPKQVHYRLALEVYDLRVKTLKEAFEAHPERFVKGTPKPLSVPTEVWINPPKLMEVVPANITPILT
ncbi:MAG: IS3 family transposase [Deltaproteobacteria bacterium]|nr:IS3 family transposase [Deltaproteobacteria bacterium]